MKPGAFTVLLLAACARIEPEIRLTDPDAPTAAYVAAELSQRPDTADFVYALTIYGVEKRYLLVVRKDGRTTLEVRRNGALWSTREWTVPDHRLAALAARARQDHVETFPPPGKAYDYTIDAISNVVIVRDGDRTVALLPGFYPYTFYTSTIDTPAEDFARYLVFQTNLSQWLITARGQRPIFRERGDF